MNKEDNKNYYELLEISTDADQQEVESAYRRGLNTYSKDSMAMYSLLSPDECDKMLDSIELAYSVLSDPKKRKDYDQARGIKSNQKESNFPNKEKKDSSDRHLSEEILKRSLSLNNEHDQFKLNEFNSTKNEGRVSKVSALNKFALDFKKNEAFEEKIATSIHFDGAFLKQIREYKNVSIERLSEMTKISKTHLRNIEAEDFEKLPAKVYTRSFVFQYAKSLKLDINRVIDSYMGRYQQNQTPNEH